MINRLKDLAGWLVVAMTVVVSLVEWWERRRPVAIVVIPKCLEDHPRLRHGL